MESGRSSAGSSGGPAGDGGDITRGQLMDEPGSGAGRSHREENHPSGQL